VKNTVGLVLEESKFSIPDNWLLFSIPNFCTVRFLSNEYRLQYDFLFPAKTHNEGVHADVIAEDVVESQVQGTRYHKCESS
jgi:hypothetical protein